MTRSLRRAHAHASAIFFTLGLQALQRVAQADDIGDARRITGDTLRVDGGSKL